MKLTELISKATKGPWKLETVKTSCGHCHKIGPFPWRPEKENHACVYVDYLGPGPLWDELQANAELIALSRTLVPELLGLVEECEETLKRYSFTSADEEGYNNQDVQEALAKIQEFREKYDAPATHRERD